MSWLSVRSVVHIVLVLQMIFFESAWSYSLCMFSSRFSPVTQKGLPGQSHIDFSHFNGNVGVFRGLTSTSVLFQQDVASSGSQLLNLTELKAELHSLKLEIEKTLSQLEETSKELLRKDLRDDEKSRLINKEIFLKKKAVHLMTEEEHLMTQKGLLMTEKLKNEKFLRTTFNTGEHVSAERVPADIPLSTPSSWVRDTFTSPVRGMLELDLDREVDGLACIINGPHLTLSNQYLGSSLENGLKTIRNVLPDPPDPRSKCVIAMVRGMGGGKTRLFEEMRRELLVEGTLAVAVTFNKNSKPHMFFPNGLKSAELEWALSLIGRMESAVTNTPYEYDLDLRIQSTFPFKELLCCSPKLLIRSYVIHLMDRYEAKALAEGKEWIAELVVMVDEAKAMEEELLEMDLNNKKMDKISIVRDSLLSEELRTSSGCVINTALVISSLTVDPIGYSSSRCIMPLQLPVVLSPSDIVTKWWKFERTASNESNMMYNGLVKIASMLQDHPRLVEVGYGVLKKVGGGSLPKALTTKVLSQVYDQLIKVGASRFIDSTLPTHQMMHSTIFRKKELIKDIERFITHSVFTNVIQSFGKNISVIPVTSAIRLAISLNLTDPSEIENDLVWKSILGLITEVKKCNTKPVHSRGFYLEDVAYKCLKMRLALAMSEQTPQTCVGELLVSPRHIYSRDLVEKFDGFIEFTDVPSSRASIDSFQFKEKLDEMRVSSKDKCVVWKSAEGDSYDFGFINKGVVYLLEMKSAFEKQLTKKQNDNTLKNYMLGVLKDDEKVVFVKMDTHHHRQSLEFQAPLFYNEFNRTAAAEATKWVKHHLTEHDEDEAVEWKAAPNDWYSKAYRREDSSEVCFLVSNSEAGAPHYEAGYNEAKRLLSEVGIACRMDKIANKDQTPSAPKSYVTVTRSSVLDFMGPFQYLYTLNQSPEN